MAEPLSVSVVYTDKGMPIAEEAVFTDTKNNTFVVTGIPGARYNLDQIANEVFAVTIAGSTVTVSSPMSSGTLIPTYMPDSSPLEAITFTSLTGGSFQILGALGASYDLELLKYLLAVVSAQDMFMEMQFGSDYLTVKNEFLQRAGLV